MKLSATEMKTLNEMLKAGKITFTPTDISPTDAIMDAMMDQANMVHAAHEAADRQAALEQAHHDAMDRMANDRDHAQHQVHEAHDHAHDLAEADVNVADHTPVVANPAKVHGDHLGSISLEEIILRLSSRV